MLQPFLASRDRWSPQRSWGRWGFVLLVAACGGVGGRASSGSPEASLFSPNTTTISTSEGAPYADCDFWTYGTGCTAQSNLGYGPTKLVRLYVCLSGEVSLGSCSQQPAVTGPLSQGMLEHISGAVTLALLIADPAPSLTTQAAYALPLNSVDQGGHPVFDPATGYNVIGVFDGE